MTVRRTSKGLYSTKKKQKLCNNCSNIASFRSFFCHFLSVHILLASHRVAPFTALYIRICPWGGYRHRSCILLCFNLSFASVIMFSVPILCFSDFFRSLSSLFSLLPSCADNRYASVSSLRNLSSISDLPFTFSLLSTRAFHLTQIELVLFLKSTRVI